ARYKRVGLIGLPLASAAFVPLAAMPGGVSVAVVAALLFLAGNGLGTVLPITTVSVQNAVLPWQLGTVTGVINFVRALTSALMVALYGAFLFGAEKGVALEGHFRWIFAAAALCLAVSWLFLLAMEERPLRTHAASDGDPLAVPAE